VSDPEHERYGAHLSKEQVEALVAPHQDSVDLVDEWLRSHGIEENDFVRSPAKDWVTLRLPVRLVEKMLDTVCCIPFHSISYTQQPPPEIPRLAACR
jgi:tripeptidyl-peptidase-1